MKLTKKLFLPGMLAFACVLTLINSGCKKVSDLNPTPKSADEVFNPDTLVYVLGYTVPAGDSSYLAAVWKNGVVTQLPGLPDKPFAAGYAMAASGSDIYVAGHAATAANSSASLPVYWKNGIINTLNVTSSYGAYVAGIAVSGNDVYVGGTAGNNHSGDPGDAGYWKNGVFTSLADPANYYNSAAWGITVSGNDVYVCGDIQIIGVGEKAVYWKNGVLHLLTDASDFAWATKIYVQNNDVYAVYDQIKEGTSIMQAHYSKNGVDVQLPTDLDGSYVTDLVINGSDAYIAGVTSHTISASFAHTKAVLWKNNVAQILFDGGASQYADAEAIAISGNNIYVAGQEGQAKQGFGYWKNGVFIKTSGMIYSNGIAVVAKSATP